MPRLSAVFAVLLVLSASHAYSQDQPQMKEPSPEALQSMMDSMAPMMGRMTEAMLEAQLKVGERPETAERIATFKRNLYQSLIKSGFSPEESMQITLSTAPPSAAPSGK